MTIGWPSARPIGSKTVRATMSVPLPAVKGTITWIGLSGHSAAAPNAVAQASDAAMCFSIFIGFLLVLVLWTCIRHGQHDERARRAAIDELPRFAGCEPAGIPPAQHDFLVLLSRHHRDHGHFAFEHDVVLFDWRLAEIGAGAGQHFGDAHPERLRGTGLLTLQPDAAHALVPGRKILHRFAETRDVHRSLPGRKARRSGLPASTRR